MYSHCVPIATSEMSLDVLLLTVVTTKAMECKMMIVWYMHVVGLHILLLLQQEVFLCCCVGSDWYRLHYMGVSFGGCTVTMVTEWAQQNTASNVTGRVVD